MAAIYVKVNGRYVAIPTLKGDTSDVSNDIISDAQSIVLPPSVKAIKDYVDDELDDALVSAINSGAGIIIADTVDDLPEDAADGTLAIVKAVEQTLQFATYNVDKLLVGENDAYLVSAALPQVFFNRHPPRADFTELGVPEQVLVMGGTGTFGAVKTIWIDNGGQTTERPHLHYAYQVDMYDMLYVPAGIIGAVPALVVNDHRLGDLLDINDPPYTRYIYFWDDFYGGDELSFGADTWHEVTAWDEDGEPTAYTEIDGMPSAAEIQCHYFSNDAAGQAAQAYFGQIINTVPFENVTFAKIDGTWTRTDLATGEPATDLTDYEKKTNKVTSISANSTDFQYPSAKAVYEYTPDLSGYEELANKVTTIDVDSTDTEYPSAKAVYDFVPEVDLVPTMTEYATVLTLNNGNYWTTTASIQFALPTPVAGKVNTFDLFVKVANSAHIVTFSAVVEWAGSVAYVFGEGTHKVCGEYDPINSKWLLTATAAGVPA